MENKQFKISELGYTCLSDSIFKKVTGIKYKSIIKPDEIRRNQLEKPQEIPEKLLPNDLFPSLFNKNETLIDKFEDYANTFLEKYKVLPKIKEYLKYSNEIHDLLNNNVYKKLGDNAKANKWSHINLKTLEISYTDSDLLSSDSIIIFDTETFVKGSGMPTNMPVLGQALYISNNKFYLSIWLHKSFDKKTEYYPTTCPIGSNHILVCHNGSFDYCRISDRFKWKEHIDGNKLPTLMICTKGMMKLIAGLPSQDLWACSKEDNYEAKRIRNIGCKGSLINCYEFITKKKTIKGLKKIRDIFVKANNFEDFWKDQDNEKIPEEYKDYNQYDLIINYSLGDLKLTSELFCGIWDKWWEQCNTPVILAGQLMLANAGLPTIEFRDEWLKKCDEVYESHKNEIAEILMNKMEDIHEAWKLGYIEPPKDGQPLSNLDWRVKKPFNYRKKVLPEGWPKRTRWWDSLENDIKLTGLEVQYMLQLEFKDIDSDKTNWYPVKYQRGMGWYYQIYDQVYKVPHFKNPGANLGNILSSDSLRFVEDENGEPLKEPRLRSNLVDQPTLIKILRYLDSLTTYKGFKNRVVDTKVIDNWSAPDLSPCHTITGRCTSSLFSTLPARFKYPKIMSEIKSTHIAPEGYKFVGFDFDGQEASFAAILSDKFKEFPDSTSNLTGMSKLGQITLTGNKKDKNDIHWLVALEVGISRPIAKNANYAAIYGAMLATLTRTIENGLPDHLKPSARPFAKKYLKSFKGELEAVSQEIQEKIGDGEAIISKIENTIWRNGIASNLYNEMSRQIMANNGNPKNIFFETLWPPSLRPSVCRKSPENPSLCNYIIQAGCSSYGMLSATLCSIWNKIQEYQLRAIYAISIHDEIWYLCKDEDVKDLVFLMFQAHLEVWCLLHIKAGLHDMPLLRAFPSGIAVDQVLRKSVKTDPSSPTFTNRWEDGKEYTVWDFVDYKIKK